MFPFLNHKDRKAHSPLLSWDIAQEGLSESYINHCLPIGGFQKLSLIDYPGHLASVLFTMGCNMRCSYCHNMQLVDPKKIATAAELNLGEIMDYLRTNNTMVDAVVISGGEPTTHKNLPHLICKLKRMGFKVKLDTNGTNPEMLKMLIDQELIDYAAMDIKAPFIQEKYHAITRGRFSDKMLQAIEESLTILKESEIDFECRTTTHESLSINDYQSIVQKVKGNYYIQQNEYDTNKSFTRLTFDEFYKRTKP